MEHLWSTYYQTVIRTPWTVYVAHAQENSILSAIDFAEANAPLKLSLPVRCLRCVLIYYVL